MTKNIKLTKVKGSPPSDCIGKYAMERIVFCSDDDCPCLFLNHCRIKVLSQYIPTRCYFGR